MTFSGLNLRRHYDSDEHDVLEQFYRPVLRKAVQYDRAVGYFSSSTFKSCASELAEFLGNEGSIRLVIGCLVALKDVEALSGAAQETTEAEREILRSELIRLLQELATHDVAAASILSKLVIAGVAQLKFAVRSEGIYHEKFGIFHDDAGGRVAFIGSANETDAALSYGMNHESFSVYRSDEPQIYEGYGIELEEKFERLWQGKTRQTRVYDVDEKVLEVMRELAARTVAASHGSRGSGVLPKLEARFELREYQSEAIKAWAENKYRGILAMATGTGKTLTAIDAVKRFKSKVPGGAVVITVPYQNLALQWAEALRDQGLESVQVFGGYTNWYDQVKTLCLASHMSKDVEFPCLVCVQDSFKDGRFQELLSLLRSSMERNHLIVVDECHHFNGPKHIAALPDHFRFRLGLSATPYDQFAEHYLDKYFDRIVYEFSLGRAIQEGFLTPYRYHVVDCSLDDDETEEYEQLTRRIVQIAGSEDGFTPETLALAQPFLLKRARIVGAARDKLLALERLLNASGRLPYTLFYCGDGSVSTGDERSRQIELVTNLLHQLGWRTARITSDESLNQREALLESLRRESIDAVVSIKVLDEGIDIPSCRVAFLMASQSSDRQGIQRRGRVLRRAEGKSSADLYDFAVLGGASNSLAMRNLAKKELRRLTSFAADATNSQAVLSELEGVAARIGITLGDLNAGK